MELGERLQSVLPVGERALPARPLGDACSPPEARHGSLESEQEGGDREAGERQDQGREVVDPRPLASLLA